MDKLLTLPSVHNPRSSRELNNLHDYVTSRVASLESLKVKKDTYGGMLSANLTKSLPTQFKLEMHKHYATDEEPNRVLSLDNILDYITREVTHLRSAEESL